MSVRESAIAMLTDWNPPDSDQDSLRHAVLAFLTARPDSCQRACEAGHITASALVVDDTGENVLLTLHPRFGRWLQLGGHCEDTDSNIVGAALREATEESGIAGLHLDPVLAAIPVHPVTCSLGVPTRLVIYPGESHGLTTPSHIEDRMQRQLDWYDLYLAPTTTGD